MNIVTREQVAADPRLALMADIVILEMDQFLTRDLRWTEREGDA